MKKIQLIASAAALILVSGAALAAPPEFGTADANGDGKIDAAEWDATSGISDKPAFEKADENGDGGLNQDEYAVAAGLDC